MTRHTDGGYDDDYLISTNSKADAVTYTFNDLDLNHNQFDIYVYQQSFDAKSIFYICVYDKNGSGTFYGYDVVTDDIPCSLGNGWHRLSIKAGDGSPAILPSFEISKVVVTVSGGNLSGHENFLIDAVCLVQQTSETAYDAAGEVAAIEDARGNVTNYRYDAMGRVAATILPDPDGDGPLGQAVTQYVYDANGNLQQSIDALGNTTWHFYDALNRQIYVTNPMTPELIASFNDLLETYTPNWIFEHYSGDFPAIKTTYDDYGRVKSVRDQLGNVTNYVYDNLGRKTREIGAGLDGNPSTNDGPVTQYAYDADGNLTAVIDPVGNVAIYEYDAFGRRTTTSQGRIIDDGDPAPDFQIQDATVTLHSDSGYGDYYRTVSSTSYLSVKYTFDNLDFNADQDFDIYVYQQPHDQNSIVVVDLYDQDGNYWTFYGWDTVTDDSPSALGNGWHKMAFKKTDNSPASLPEPERRIGKVVVRIYNTTVNFKIDAVCLVQRTSETAYDAAGNVVAMEDPRGNVTNYEYDNLSRKTKEIQPAPQQGWARPTTCYGYDADGNLKYVTDPRGSSKLSSAYTTYYFYDFLNRPVCTIDALGQDWQTEAAIPDAAPAPTAHNHSTRTVYDAAGDVVKEIDQLGHVTAYQYDRLGQVTDTYEADPDGSAGQQTSPHTHYDYDLLGNQIAVVDPLGNTTAYQYDELGRLVKTVDPLGRVSTTGYNAAGNVLSDTDAAGNTTYYVYDHLNRMTDKYDPDTDGFIAYGGPRTQYAYYADGKRKSLTDPDGNTTTWTYDAFRHMTKETVSNTGTTLPAKSCRRRAPPGNLVWQQDRDGRVTTFAYDALNRKTLEKWYQSGTDIYQIEYSYDNANYLTDIYGYDPSNENVCDYTYQYFDQIGRLCWTYSWFYQLNYDQYQDFNYEFWDNGLLKKSYENAQIDLIDGQNSTTVFSISDAQNDYVYDNLNRLITITQQSQSGGAAVQEKRVDFTYDAAGQYKTITTYSSLDDDPDYRAFTSAYSYDAAGQLLSLAHRNGPSGDNLPSAGLPASIVTGYHYVYDNSGRATLTSTTHLGQTQLNNYSYDNTDQVLAANYDVGQTGESFQYDASGNRTSTDGTANTHNKFNRILSDGHYRYDFDNEGNLIHRYVDAGANGYGANDTDITVYTYDNRNRLTKVEHKDVYGGSINKSVDYLYDALNRRIERKADANGAGTGGQSTEFYFYDGGNVILDAIDADGGATGVSPVPAHRYLWGEAVDQLLAQENIRSDGQGGWESTPDDLFWILQDRRQSTGDAINASGRVQIHNDYDAFGNTHPTESDYAGGQLDEADVPRYQYTCQELDPLTGQYYYNARWYNPKIGRFLSEDPSGFDAGDANLYRYVGNNPINLTDPRDCAASGADRQC